jgi:hypothetical protein
MAYERNEKSKLTWIPVNVDAMGATLKQEYLTMKESQRKAKADRERFEARFLTESKKARKVPEGGTLRYAYNFGRLVVAIVDEEKAVKKSETVWF